MKELIEGLLFVALLKFLGVPMWLTVLGSILFLSSSSSICPFSPLIHEGDENSRFLSVTKNNKPKKLKKPNVLDKKPTRIGMQGLYERKNLRREAWSCSYVRPRVGFFL